MYLSQFLPQSLEHEIDVVDEEISQLHFVLLHSSFWDPVFILLQAAWAALQAQCTAYTLELPFTGILWILFASVLCYDLSSMFLYWFRKEARLYVEFRKKLDFSDLRKKLDFLSLENWTFSAPPKKAETPSRDGIRRPIQQSRSGNNGGRKSHFLLSPYHAQFFF